MSLGAKLSAKLQFLAKIDNVVAIHHFEKILPDADGIVIVR
jgi:pyruvate kinase